MHSVSDYVNVLQLIISQAREMVSRADEQIKLQGEKILSFLCTYGCFGFPGGEEGIFNLGSWIARNGTPRSQYKAVSIIPCFSDDTPPIKATDGRVNIGRCDSGSQVIVLYDVDQWSCIDLALALLHEGRHARHKLGIKLGGLPPMDLNNRLHEGNTWMFMLQLLNTWNKHAWEVAVRHELAWLRDCNLQQPGPGQLVYDASGTYWPELDDIFCPTVHSHVRQMRQRLVSFNALMIYWSSEKYGFSAEQVCHSLLKYEYHE